MRKFLYAFLLALLGLCGLAGCSSPNEESSIPWSRPADWEGRIPGMGK